MRRKYAEDLAKEYDFQEKEEYFDYIVDSLINGHRQQVRDLFNKMKPESRREFLIDYLDESIGYHKSVKNICIDEMCK